MGATWCDRVPPYESIVRPVDLTGPRRPSAGGGGLLRRETAPSPIYGQRDRDVVLPEFVALPPTKRRSSLKRHLSPLKVPLATVLPLEHHD